MKGEKAKLQQENSELKLNKDELAKEIRESEAERKQMNLRIESLQSEKQVLYILFFIIILFLLQSCNVIIMRNRKSSKTCRKSFKKLFLSGKG